MDGVIYRGSRLIDGAAEFIELLRRRNIPFLFLTNNSQRTRRDVAHKLTRMGIPADAEDVFTCGIATARYLAERHPGGTAYVIGENGLTSALFKNNYTVVDDDADFVVVGEGRTLSFEMIEKATGKQAFSVGKPSPMMISDREQPASFLGIIGHGILRAATYLLKSRLPRRRIRKQARNDEAPAICEGASP